MRNIIETDGLGDDLFDYDLVDEADADPDPDDLEDGGNSVVKVGRGTIESLFHRYGRVNPDRLAKVGQVLDYREKQMLSLLLKGEKDRRIQIGMVMAPSSVKAMKASILKKLDVTTLTGLFALVHNDTVKAPVRPGVIVPVARGKALARAAPVASDDHVPAEAVTSSVWDRFSQEQAQVVRGIVSGKEPRKIADEMGISDYDATQILISVYDQLNIANRAKFLAFMVDKPEPNQVGRPELSL